MTVLQATAHSVNTAYVNMSKQLDLCEIVNIAGRFGLERMTPIAIGGGKTSKKLQPYPAAVLGVQEVSPLSMAAAYAGFANEGKFCTPVFTTQIVARGKELKVPKTTCKQAVTKEVAAGMTYALSKVISQGTAASAIGGIGRPAAGKTGTTDESVDTWFVGYTAQLSTAVWVADPDKYGQNRRKLKNIVINGRYYRALYGGSIAAPTWKRIMVPASRGMPVVGFNNPPSKMLASEGIPLPNFTGQPVDAVQAILERMGFEVEVAGGQVPSPAPAGTVAYTTPGAGSRVAPESTITIHISGGGGGGGLPGGRNNDNNGGNNGNNGGDNGGFDLFSRNGG
jgi:membrane peptidoglycan carboxypeptidase